MEKLTFPIYRFSDEEIAKLDKIIHSTAHLIIRFAKEGGFKNASVD